MIYPSRVFLTLKPDSFLAIHEFPLGDSRPVADVSSWSGKQNHPRRMLTLLEGDCTVFRHKVLPR